MSMVESGGTIRNALQLDRRTHPIGCTGALWVNDRWAMRTYGADASCVSSCQPCMRCAWGSAIDQRRAVVFEGPCGDLR